MLVVHAPQVCAGDVKLRGVGNVGRLIVFIHSSIHSSFVLRYYDVAVATDLTAARDHGSRWWERHGHVF